MKRIAKAFVPEGLDDYEPSSLLAGTAAFWYFQRLDAMVRDWTARTLPSGGPMLNYLLVTYVVETRAASLYPALQALSVECGLPANLKGIIAEEDKHLLDIRMSLSEEIGIDMSSIDELLVEEESLFERLTERWIASSSRGLRNV
jgi:hypothetical protein